MGQRTQKQDGTQHASFWKSCGVGSCALHENDVRSLLKHHAHWWHQGPQSTTACCASYVYILLVAVSVRYNYILNLSHLSSRYLFLGSRLVCFAAKGARTKHGRTEHRAKWKLNDGGSWPKEHENEDMKMTNGEWSWKMRHDERWVKTSLYKKLLCVKATVCKRVCADKFLCVKVPLCKSFFAYQLLSVKAPLC